MKRSKLFSVGVLSATLISLLTASQSARAGLPLTCFPFDIGGAKSLPWDDALVTSGRADYDLARLTNDTLELLAPGTPVIVRMETIRRAALYAQKDPVVAKQLLLKLRARAFDSEGKGQADALAWFDLGYFIETFKQANTSRYNKLPSGSLAPVQRPNVAMELDGYAWVQKAIALRGDDAEMEFAAAVITSYPRQKLHEDHLRRAIAGAKEGSLLAKNLVTHFRQEGTTMAELRAKWQAAK
jgi:hypothetical protein